jgi:Na+-transporting NADH:ubiquinone oxidoreductase subunit NqrD
MIGKIVMIVGLLGVLLGAAVLFISLLLPVVTDGRTSWDEALLGIIPGAFVLTISFIIFVAGLIVVLVQRKKKRQLQPSQVVSQP